MTRTGRRDRGQTSVEFAVVLPVVVLLLLVVVQVALVVRDHLLVVHSAREAVRAAAVATSDRQQAAEFGATRAGPLDASMLTVQTRISDSDSRVEVEVRYTSRTDLPVVGALLPDVTLTSSAVMRLESTGRPAGR